MVEVQKSSLWNYPLNIDCKFGRTVESVCYQDRLQKLNAVGRAKIKLRGEKRGKWVYPAPFSMPQISSGLFRGLGVTEI